MPFDASGNYTLPQAPFVTNTTISSSAMNSDLSDIASALTITQKNTLTLATANVLGFQNKADAVAATIAAPVNYVILEGYTTPGDCDGIQLVFIRGTTPTQGSFVSADGQRWILQNKNPHVGMFGAVGDGTTDDSTAILNAIAFVKTNSVHGGTIWFSTKVYAVGTTITIGDGGVGTASTYNGIVLAGNAGVGASAIEFTADLQGATLKWVGAAGGTLVSIQGPITSCSIKDMCLHGNVTCAITLLLTHSYKGFFENVLIKKYSQNNATDIGLSITSRATFGAVTVTGDENTFINVAVEDAGNNTGIALNLSSSNRNSFYRCLFAIPGTGNAIKIISTGSLSAKGNSFTGLKVPQQNTGTGTAYSTTDGGAGLNDITYQHFNAADVVMWNGTFKVTAGGGALTVALKTLSGDDPSPSDPVFIPFRNATGTTGDYTVLPVTAATSVVTGVGSTYGVASNTAFRLWVVGFNNSGTLKLGLTQTLSGSGVNGSYIIQPPIEGLNSSIQDAAFANSAGIIYTTGAAVTTKPMRILGYLEWSTAGLTAGTWTVTNLSLVQLFGPGIKKPGEIVQIYTFTSTALNTSTSSLTFVIGSTPFSGSALNSAANLLRLDTTVIGFATGEACIAQWSRGSVANTNMIGTLGEAGSTTAATVAIANPRLLAYDLPNATTATYAIQVKSAAGAPVNLGNGQRYVAELWEIMT